MEVYRVERTGSGDGPFTQGEHLNFDEVDYTDYTQYPTLWDDIHLSGLEPLNRTWVTGVLTRRLVDYWFPPLSDFRNYLKENGYKLITYDVHPDNVRHGRSSLQLVFARGRATKTKEEEL